MDSVKHYLENICAKLALYLSLWFIIVQTAAQWMVNLQDTGFFLQSMIIRLTNVTSSFPHGQAPDGARRGQTKHTVQSKEL